MANRGAPLEPMSSMQCTRCVPHCICRSVGEMQPGWKERGMPCIDIGIGLNPGIMSMG
jgi:hypothetical protein